jgi:hypothetical protein
MEQDIWDDESYEEVGDADWEEDEAEDDVGSSTWDTLFGLSAESHLSALYHAVLQG